MNNKDMPDLLPCPFCGGEAALGWGENYRFVNCINGCADNSSQAEMVRYDEEDAIAAWNTREDLAPAPKAAEDEVFRKVDLSKRKPEKMGWYNFVSSTSKPSNLGRAFFDGKKFNFNTDGFYGLLNDGHTAFWLEEISLSEQTPTPPNAALDVPAFDELERRLINLGNALDYNKSYPRKSIMDDVDLIRKQIKVIRSNLERAAIRNTETKG